jgi:hypothetical protein
LRPLTVYPSEMVYWSNLPTVSIFQALHFDIKSNSKRFRVFWIAFWVMFVYEIFPAYIFPLLNGISIVCLATQSASPGAVNVITNLFGGTDGNEGLGFMNFGFDWQYITSGSMSFPLLQQGKHSTITIPAMRLLIFLSFRDKVTLGPVLWCAIL